MSYRHTLRFSDPLERWKREARESEERQQHAPDALRPEEERLASKNWETWGRWIDGRVEAGFAYERNALIEGTARRWGRYARSCARSASVPSKRCSACSRRSSALEERLNALAQGKREVFQFARERDPAEIEELLSFLLSRKVVH